MQELAAEIRNNLAVLAGEYDQRLQHIGDYAAMPSQARYEAAQGALQCIATSLEAGEPQIFAREQVALGVGIESAQQALSALAQVLAPRLASVEAANAWWWTIFQAHQALSRLGTDPLRSSGDRKTSWHGARPTGYLFDQTDVMPAHDLWQPEMELAVQEQHLIPPGDHDHPAAIAPLAARGGEMIGVLGVQDDPSAPLSSEDLSLVESVSEQVSQALESARLFEETQQRLRDLTMLSEISQTLTSAPLQAVEISSIIARQFVAVLGAEEASVSVTNPVEEGTLVVLADLTASGFSPPVAPEQFRLADFPVTARVLETQRPLVVQASDPDADPAELAYMREAGTRTRAILPLVSKGQAFGVIELETLSHEHVYTAEELNLAITLGNQAAVALDNARLFDETQKALDEADALYRASIAFNASQSYDQVLAALREHTLFGQADRLVSIDLFDRPWGLTETPESIAIASRWTPEPLPDALNRYLIQDFGSFFDLLLPDQPLIVTNVHADDRLDDNMRALFSQEFRAQAVISAPLTVGGQWIGYINAQFSEPTDFAQAKVRRLMAAAAQAAVAIQGLQRLVENQARTEDLAVLNDLGQALTARLTVGEVVQEAYEQTSRLVDTTNFYIGLYDEDRAEISLPLVVSQSEIDRQIQSIPADQGLTGYVIRNRSRLLLADNVSERQEALGIALVGAEAQSWLGVPLMIGDQVLGAMAVQSLTTPRLYDEHDLDMMTAIAGVVASALQNAILFERTQAAARELEEEQGLLRTLIDSIPDYIYVKDRQGRFLLNNAAHLKVLGIEHQQDALGRSDFDLFDRDLAEQYSADEQQVIQSGQALDGREEPTLTPEGRQQWLLTTKVPLLNREGQITGLVGISRDITTLKESEIEMQDTLGELQHLYGAMSREGWETIWRSSGTIAYQSDQGNVVPASDLWQPEIGSAVERRSPMSGRLYPDLAQEPGREPMAVMPLAARGGEFIGVLGIQDDPEDPLSPEELAMVEGISQEISLALDSARLFEEARSRAEEQALLRRVTETVSRSRETRKVLDSALEMLLESMGFDAGLFSLVDEAGGDLYLAAEHHIPAPMARKLRRDGLADTLCDHVHKTGEALSIADVRQGAPVEVAGVIAQGLLTYAGVPLIYLGERLGTICLFHRSVRQTDERELALLQSIADQIAIGIANARLFEESQSSAEEQALLRRVTETVSRSMETQEMLDSSLETMLETMGYDAGLVSLIDETGGDLYLAAEHHIPAPMAAKLQREGLADTLCDYVYQTGEALNIADVRQGAPVEVAGVIAQGLLTYAGVPLLYLDERLGTICLFHRSVRQTDEHEMALLQSIADQIAIGIANARLFERTQTALATVQATHQSYLRRSWQEQLRQRELLREGGFLYDEDQARQGQEVTLVSGLWRPEMERALQDQEPAHEAQAAKETHAGLAVPITLRGQTLGVIGVEAPSGDHQWTAEDAALIEAVSEQLAQTLESARLFEETQRTAQRERLIGEITTKIRASTDLHDIVKTAAEELGKALGTSRAAVRLSPALSNGVAGPDPMEGSVQPVPLDGNEESLSVSAAREGQEVRDEN